MVKILKQNSLGELLGQGLNQGVSSGVQTLMNMKLQQMQQQQAVNKGAQFWKGLGLPDQMAYQFASAPEAIQKNLLERLEGLQFGIPQPQSGMNALQTLQQPQQQFSPEQQQMMSAEQNLVPQQLQPSLVQPQQQGLRIGASPIERRHKETLQQQAQMHAEKLAAPVLKQIEEHAVPARKVTTLAQETLDILKTGKVITGLGGKITPNYLQTEEGQQFLTKINEIVLQKAQLGKGVPSRLRLQLEQLSKPDVWQKPKAIERLLNDLINDKEMQRQITLDQAREEILEENDGIPPRGIKSLIEKRARELEKQHELKQNSFDSLPDASLFKGKIAENSETGEQMRSNGKNWIAVEE